MAEQARIRFRWLKGMYLYTILVAGGFGLGLLASPRTLQVMFGWPEQDPLILGIVASVYVAFGILSILGLGSPLKFVPVLLLQMSYKIIWFLAVFLPNLLAGRVAQYGWVLAVIFATFVIGDLIAIPFSTVLKREGGAGS
jgi:hypothetical protein